MPDTKVNQLVELVWSAAEQYLQAQGYRMVFEQAEQIVKSMQHARDESSNLTEKNLSEYLSLLQQAIVENTALLLCDYCMQTNNAMGDTHAKRKNGSFEAVLFDNYNKTKNTYLDQDKLQRPIDNALNAAKCIKNLYTLYISEQNDTIYKIEKGRQLIHSDVARNSYAQIMEDLGYDSIRNLDNIIQRGNADLAASDLYKQAIVDLIKFQTDQIRQHPNSLLNPFADKTKTHGLDHYSPDFQPQKLNERYVKALAKEREPVKNDVEDISNTNDNLPPSRPYNRNNRLPFDSNQRYRQLQLRYAKLQEQHGQLQQQYNHLQRQHEQLLRENRRRAYEIPPNPNTINRINAPQPIQQPQQFGYNGYNPEPNIIPLQMQPAYNQPQNAFMMPHQAQSVYNQPLQYNNFNMQRPDPHSLVHTSSHATNVSRSNIPAAAQLASNNNGILNPQQPENPMHLRAPRVITTKSTGPKVGGHS